LATSSLCRFILGESVRVRRHVRGWVGSRAGSMSLPGNEPLFPGDTARSLVNTIYWLHACNTIHSLTRSFFRSFIHSFCSLTTGPQSVSKRVLHRKRSSTSFFNFQYSLLSLKSSSSYLGFLPCLPVVAITPFIVPSITCVRKKLLRKTWPI
jgi:hypothetical protein